MISGTSAGSILAIMLHLNFDMEKIETMIFEACEEIFSNQHFKHINLIKNGYMYDNQKFIDFANKYLSEKTTKDIKNDFCIPSYEIANQVPILKIFSKNDDAKLADIILASSSAPFYFDPYKIGE